MCELIWPAPEIREFGVQLHGRPDRIRPARQEFTDDSVRAMAPDIAEQRPGMMFRERLLPLPKDRRAKPSRHAVGPAAFRNVVQARAQQFMRQLQRARHPPAPPGLGAETQIPIKRRRKRLQHRGDVAQPQRPVSAVHQEMDSDESKVVFGRRRQDGMITHLQLNGPCENILQGRKKEPVEPFVQIDLEVLSRRSARRREA